ncbi:MAG: SpoIIE family protein phosphatase [Planctomycetia bacterium]|nr:SpoIIE family protein phosphatase [Planctomycetia bacterium]
MTGLDSNSNAGRDILLVQEDPDVRTAWSSAVKIAGFTPHVLESVEGLFEALLDERAWRGVVVDLGFRGADAMAFLDNLTAMGHTMPVVVTAWEEGVATSKHARAYPAFRFHPAPLQPRELVTAIRQFPAPQIQKPKNMSDSQVIRIHHQREGILKKETNRDKGTLLPQAAAERAEREKAEAEAARAPVRDEKMEREMERAREIQARLLPESIPHPDGFEIAAQYIPAEHVGGDYYDVIQLPDGRVAMLVADVSGKGISAAMVMVMARTVFHAVAPFAPNARQLVVQAAASIARDLPGGIFLSLACGVLDPASGEISVVNAGHMPPKHWTILESKPVVCDLDVSGGAIGLVKGALFERTLKDITITLQPDEQLVFYTDGVNEAMNEANEEFGDKSLHLSVKKNGGSTAEEMAQGILDAVLYHRGDAPASDDITILVVRRIW